MSEALEGFVIQGPGCPIQMCFHTFAPTMEGAWLRHVGYRERPIGELAVIKGRWRERGWRPVHATLVLSREDRT